MVNKILSTDIENYPNGIKVVQHNLPSTDLFTEQALAQAIEEHPPHLVDICVDGTFSSCERNGFSGAELIEAVKQGNLWISLKHIETVNSPIGRLIKTLHAEFEHTMGRKTQSKIGGLLISSPKATVGYHFDFSDVALHHIHGSKRIYIYPNEPPYLDSKKVEELSLAQGIERIPYDEKFDQLAHTIDLEPGQMISWPHLSPHRIDNVSGLNVSMSLESMCLTSRLIVGQYFFDGFTYKHFKTRVFPQSKNKTIQFMKTCCAVFIRKSGKLNRKDIPIEYAYKLDANAANFLTSVNT
ncbi:MAG: hypothetical protein ACPGVT_05985 [Maricaulaceae bacterium]